MSKIIKEYINKPGKMLYAIVVLSIMLLSVSYGIFVITSSDYKASELMVGNLLYGITIHDTDKVLQSNPVIVSTGETTFYITISSVNSISSKYTLAYNNNNVTVSASNKSGWNASGSMTNYNNYAYSKTVKVKVTNNSGSNQSVTFAAFGGYSYNSTSNIPLGNGYYSVANFTDVAQISGELLTDIVEEDTNCNSSNCLYGGEATTNYFTFEEDGDLYRILGTYTLDNDKVTKIASNTLTEVTSSSNLSTSLNTIKSSLDTDHIYSTNKFNCQGMASLTCTTSSYTDLGILSLDEYKQLEGDNSSSYLYNSNEYYLLNNTTLVSNTNQSNSVTSARIRPTMYLDNEVKVTGSGTSADPYVLEPNTDFDLVAIMVEQIAGEGDYFSSSIIPTGDYKLNGSESYCTVNGVVANGITLSYASNGLLIKGMSSVGTKCYLYFDIDNSIQTTMAKASLGERNNFNQSFSTNGTTYNYTAGVYETDDTIDGSTVYYYSGNVQNNWVRFGNNGSGTCYYWRVIRTNTEAEGGGVRLLYAGSSTTCTGSVPVMTNATIGSYYYATSDASDNNSSYVGYMYTLNSQFGYSTSSYAKQQAESWYTSSGLSNFSDKINEDAIYCGDRTIQDTYGSYGTWSATGTKFGYKSAYRLGNYYNSNGKWTTDSSIISPSLECNNYNDKYSKETNGGGNGYLAYPIALITADEIAYAGGLYDNDSYSYYSYASNGSSKSTGSKTWWTMSPAYWNGSYSSVFWIPDGSYHGRLDLYRANSTANIRPVVSLSSSASINGSGTVANPWVVQ